MGEGRGRRRKLHRSQTAPHPPLSGNNTQPSAVLILRHASPMCGGANAHQLQERFSFWRSGNHDDVMGPMLSNPFSARFNSLSSTWLCNRGNWKKSETFVYASPPSHTPLPSHTHTHIPPHTHTTHLLQVVLPQVQRLQEHTRLVAGQLRQVVLCQRNLQQRGKVLQSLQRGREGGVEGREGGGEGRGGEGKGGEGGEEGG